MPQPKKVFYKNPTIIASTILAILLFLGIKKGIEYAAAPTSEKDCGYAYPNYSDQTKPTEIVLKQNSPRFEFQQKGGMINDASCLNKTSVFGIAKITSVDDVKNAILYANENNLKVTSAGERHSMGGQSFIQSGLVLDMRKLNHMKLDEETKILTVQSGANWAAVQEYLDAKGFSVKAMQSINIFTVGGTLSVNAHGIAHNPGQIAPTVKAMRVMIADGTIVTASPTQNTELFKHVLGGYGLFGVILDVDLEVVPNEMYTWTTDYIDYTEFPTFYKDRIANNDDVGLMYARLSPSPTGYLTETAVHTFTKTTWDKPIPPLQPDTLSSLNRFVINLSKTGDFGRWIRWQLEKHVENKFHTCVSRNEAMSPNEVCTVVRNQEMYDSMKYLKNKLPDTDILQEYFIPPEKMVEFVDGLREVVQKNNANLLNVTIRIVHKDTITSLPYATDDRFAFVLYFNQKLNDEESKVLEKTTSDLISLAESVGGTFYLPYQLYYSPEQLRAAYPNVDSFFIAKKKFDPSELFMNTWYKKYSDFN